MNTFEKHNISYLSPSTINLFISQPALCMLKFAGYTDDEVGPPAWRGTAVDKAVGKGVIEGWELEHLTPDLPLINLGSLVILRYDDFK